MSGAWVEAPESSYAVIGLGEDHVRRFTPRAA